MEITFSSFWSKLIISTALTLVIVGKIVTIIKKSKSDRNISKDVGIIIGLLIVLVSRLLK
ncbi:hypothetical protein [Clostridium cylindrosporum]|uniref:hypothetical protein n=1 Tax=Clostridium cylindrosporum TaxID=1495 RepID=UPI00065C9E21|nr:hypothetical protein [Clostridium cylindrosporum]